MGSKGLGLSHIVLESVLGREVVRVEHVVRMLVPVVPMDAKVLAKGGNCLAHPFHLLLVDILRPYPYVRVKHPRGNVPFEY